MTAVLVGKFVAFVTRAPECSEMPLCDWPSFALGGFIFGAVTLPVLAILRLRRNDVRDERESAAQSDRTVNDTSKQG